MRGKVNISILEGLCTGEPYTYHDYEDFVFMKQDNPKALSLSYDECKLIMFTKTKKDNKIYVHHIALDNKVSFFSYYTKWLLKTAYYKGGNEVEYCEIFFKEELEQEFIKAHKECYDKNKLQLQEFKVNLK